MRIIQIIVFFVFSFTLYGQVTVEYVTSINDAGAGSLRAALATGNDTVVIDVKGTVDVESSIPLSSNVVILGPSPKHFSIEMSNLLDANGLFTFNGFEVELNGVELKSGVNGVFNINSSNNTSALKVNRCLFFENRLTGSNVNGSTFNLNSSGTNIKINACSFWGNESNIASGLGGAIYLNFGNLEVYNSTFHNNQSNKGGAICASNVAANNHLISIINNTFDNNVATQGNDLYLNNSDLHLRNNIFRNADDPVYATSLNTLTTPQHNFTNYSGGSFSSLEHHTSLGLRNSSITDGFGLMYYLFNDHSSPCIDVDSNPLINLQLDARRSWRKMYGKAVLNMGQYLGGDAVDAGAVEYTPFRVTNSSNSGIGSIVDVFDALNNPVVNVGLGQTKRTVVFELPITSGVVADIDMFTTSLNVVSSWSSPSLYNDSLIINGFSQNYSAIAGPGVNSNIVTPAFIPIQLNGGGGDGSRLIINASNVFVTGLSFINSISTAGVRGTGIEISNSSWDVSIEGCHIGVDGNGNNVGSNSFGLYSESLTYVGVRKYLKGYQHASRNVITGNDSTQLRMVQGGKISNNFIGLLANGSSPSGTYDKGVEVFDGYASFDLGGNNNQSNYFGKLITAVETPVGNIYNNYFGFEYDLQTASNIETGIKTKFGDGSTGNVIVRRNFLGNILGSAVENIVESSIFVGNTFGINPNGRGQAPIGGNGISLIGGANSISNWTVNGGNCKIGTSGFFSFPSEPNIIVNCGNAGVAFVSGTFKDPFSEDPPMPSDIRIPINATIKGNYIGVDTAVVNLNANFGNGVGILIPDSVYKIQIDSNKIARNIGAGIAIGDSSEFNWISKNIMYRNGGLGIDLDANNIANITELNKPTANHGVIPPEFLNVIYCDTDTSTKLKLRVYIEDYSLVHGIEFYKADIDSQEGFEFKKYENISPSFNGWNTFELSYSSNVTTNQQIVATLTVYQDSLNKEASTSEFSAPFTIGDYQPRFSMFEDSLCLGDSAVIQFTDYGSFQSLDSFFSVSQINDSTGYFIASSVVQDTLEVTVDSLGCVVVMDSILTVFNSPVVDLGNDTSICDGTTVDLTSIASGGQWKDLTYTNLLSNVFTMVSDTAFIFEQTLGGCSNNDTIIMTKLSVDTSSINQNICFGETYTLGTQILSTSGTYMETFQASNGCDSVVMLTLIVSPQITGVDVQTSCGSYTWIDGVTYTSSNTTATNTIVGGASNGCDSVVTLNLTVFPVVTGIDVKTACGSFIWIDGVTYTSSNTTATHTIVGGASNGCDSTVTLNLTINNTSYAIPSISNPIKYCEGEQKNVVDNEPSNQGVPHYYLYNGNQYDFSDENLIIDILLYEDDSIGFFTGNSGCFSDTLYVDLEYVSNDISISSDVSGYCEGDNATFKINSSNTIDSVKWEINGTLDSLYNLGELFINSVKEGYYFFKVATSGCEFKDSLLIQYDEDCGKGNVVTTNAFSPNGSLAENTTFNIDLDYINNGIPNVVTVYNRWGDVIFKVNDYDNEENVWHGDNQSGEAMPEGTYFYVVEVPSKSFSTSGWVYLDRKN